MFVLVCSGSWIFLESAPAFFAPSLLALLTSSGWCASICPCARPSEQLLCSSLSRASRDAPLHTPPGLQTVFCVVAVVAGTARQ